MGLLNNTKFLTDFTIRTRENQLRLEDISHIYLEHGNELKILDRLAADHDALNKVAKAVADIIKEKGIAGAEQISSGVIRELFSLHGSFEKRAQDAYENMEKPPYWYFDGTQMINSFLGLIVLPFERFRFIDRTELESIMRRDRDDYNCLYQLIDRLYVRRIPDDDRPFIYTNYNGYDMSPNSGTRVWDLWYHLRNAFAHSGNGTLFFYPISESENENGDYEKKQNVTHIAFFDKRKERRRDGVETGRYLHFMAKIEVQDVYQIGEAMKGIVRTLERQYPSNMPSRFRDAKNQVFY